MAPYVPTIQQQPMSRPGCPDMCGNMSIPFPFGIGPGCFRHGFEVLCEDSRAFLADSIPKNRKAMSNVKYEDRDSGNIKQVVYYTGSHLFDNVTVLPLPVELASMSVAIGEARAYSAISYGCLNVLPGSVSTVQAMNLSRTPFAVSATRNVAVGIGSRTSPLVYYYGKVPGDLLTCTSRLASSSYARNGSCTGRGCCQDTPSANDPGFGKDFTMWVTQKATWSSSNECAYGMLVDKSWYNFSTLDLKSAKEILQKFPQGVPLVLDFSVGNTYCPAEGGQPRSPLPDYACVSGNSSCANATYAYTPGYICKCWDGYGANPYLPNGCQDIDECKQLENPCSNGGKCKNRLGGYDCPCKFGMKGDGKGGTCTHIFTTAAKATGGAIGCTLLMAIISFLIILYKEKKKMEELYKKNGGPVLEKANGIKIFTKGELKPILKSSNIIGKGGFGEVYKGLLDNKEVAIKKPINGTVRENEQFANEVIIQSQVIHKNIVRLIGCCLEVEAPMLVYEFISQGSLHDILHNNKVPLTLDARLSIAAQSANGLAYMHSQANTRILHGDVKPKNILLDENFAPKISDFGISRLLAREKQHTASIIGDVNYMDPVYLQQGLLTEKSDVYGFGVVILELISRRKAIHSDNNSLVKCFLEAHKEQKKATEFFDKEIAIPEDLELLDSLAGMAVECLSLDVDQRPTMMKLAEQLHKLSQSCKVQDVCH